MAGDGTGDGGKDTSHGVLVLEHRNVEYCNGWKISKTLTNTEVAATEDGRTPHPLWLTPILGDRRAAGSWTGKQNSQNGSCVNSIY